MKDGSEIDRRYYKKTAHRQHSLSTEYAVSHNQTGNLIAIDAGCGSGNDAEYLTANGYHVHAFDKNPDAVSSCRVRFSENNLATISHSTFEDFQYPLCSVVVAHSSLFFASPSAFDETWWKITSSIINGGVFAGDFMGPQDDWANSFRLPTCPINAEKIKELFSHFEILKFLERNKKGKTALGVRKHWHTFSVVALKRTQSG